MCPKSKAMEESCREALLLTSTLETDSALTRLCCKVRLEAAANNGQCSSCQTKPEPKVDHLHFKICMCLSTS